MSRDKESRDLLVDGRTLGHDVGSVGEQDNGPGAEVSTSNLLYAKNVVLPQAGGALANAPSGPGGPFVNVDPRDLTPIQAAQMIRDAPHRRWELERIFQEVRGPEFVRRVWSALLTPDVHAEDPVLAGMLVKRVQAGKEGLRIAGGAAFVQRIVQELHRAAMTNTGRVVIEELLAGAQVTTITYVREDAYEDNLHGVAIDPGVSVVLLGPGNVPITTTPATILVHELLHAVHDLRQELDRRTPVRHADYDTREEENTEAGYADDSLAKRPAPLKPIPLISWPVRIQPTENSFRAETGQPERFGHHGFDGPAHRVPTAPTF